MNISDDKFDIITMYILIGLVYMFAVTSNSSLAILEAVTTYSRTHACDRTIKIGSNIFSVLIDFSLPVRRTHLFTNFSCTFGIETSPGSLIAIKFISSANNSDELTHRCRNKVTITSAQLNIMHCDSFAKSELLSYDHVNVKYERAQVHAPYHKSKPFKLLLFTYSYPNRFGKCQNNRTSCVGSGRCIHESLKCSNVYDFCDNKMRNCQNQTYMKSSNVREASFSGVYIFLSCLIFLLGITFYMCFCQGVHLSECLCHCCSVLEKNGIERSRQRNNIDNDLTSQENVQEVNNTITTSTDNLNGDENVRDNDITLSDNESNTESSECVTYGLPPSYSFVVTSGPRDNISNTDILHVDNVPETNRDSAPTVPTDLPPSYSTVLGHEEEYSVHVIQ